MYEGVPLGRLLFATAFFLRRLSVPLISLDHGAASRRRTFGPAMLTASIFLAIE
jgi:hypothetical protein